MNKIYDAYVTFPYDIETMGKTLSDFISIRMIASLPGFLFISSIYEDDSYANGTIFGFNIHIKDYSSTSSEIITNIISNSLNEALSIIVYEVDGEDAMTWSC